MIGTSLFSQCEWDRILNLKQKFLVTIICLAAYDLIAGQLCEVYPVERTAALKCCTNMQKVIVYQTLKLIKKVAVLL